MFVNDIIQDSYRHWQVGDWVYIDASTGAGKTTFILQKLLIEALYTNREILYLTNRIGLNNQLVTAVCKKYNVPPEFMMGEATVEFPGITFATYQAVQERLTDPLCQNFPRYDYIVLDEAHYVVADALINPKIPRFLCWLNSCESSVRVAISATLKPALRYLDNTNYGWTECYSNEMLKIDTKWKPCFPGSYNYKQVRRFYYSIPRDSIKADIFIYDDVDMIVDLINGDETDEKWLVFQSSKDRIFSKIDSKIKCSHSCVTADDKESVVMKQIIEESCFEDKVLVATQVLDNGINIIDPKVKNIVLETIDEIEFIQMLGRRRRIDGEETQLRIYLPRLSVLYLSGLLYKNILPTLNLLKLSHHELKIKAFLDTEVQKKVSHFFDYQNGNLILSEVGKEVLEQKKNWTEEMLARMKNDPNAFVSTQLSWLGLTHDTASVTFLSELKKERSRQALLSLLHEFQNRELEKAEQNEFASLLEVPLRVLLPEDFSKKRTPHLNVLNRSLEKLQMGYQIQSIPGKNKGEKTIWILQEITSESM